MIDHKIFNIGKWTLIIIMAFFGILWFFFPSVDYETLIAKFIDYPSISVLCLGFSGVLLSLILLLAMGNIATSPSRSRSTTWEVTGIEGALKEYFFLTKHGGTFYNLFVHKPPAPFPHPDRDLFQQLGHEFIVDPDELEREVRKIADGSGWPIKVILRDTAIRQEGENNVRK